MDPIEEIEAIDQEKKEEKINFLVKWLKFKDRNIRIFFLVCSILLGVMGCIIAGYFCLYKWLPPMWDWGFGAHGSTMKGVLAVLGALYLVIGAFIPIFLISGTVEGIIKLFADDAEKEFNDKISEITKKQNSYEDKLEKNDTLGLIPLVTYSRIELEQYYKIGLTQTQRSYTYSIVSMWIGFIIIIIGIIFYIVPNKFVNENYASGNLQVLVIASGIVTEFISALFLWIYKSSINNLTYFYNRQIFIHNTLLAFKISTSMNVGDEAKKIIVEKILDFGFKTHNSVFEKRNSNPKNASH